MLKLFFLLQILLIFCVTGFLFCAQKFFPAQAWIYFFIGGAYCTTSMALFAIILGGFLSGSRTVVLALLAMPFKLILLLLVAYLLADLPGELLAWSLAGLLSFIPASLFLSVLQREP